jgi:hypothetical protein
MKRHDGSTQLVDTYLESVQGMQEATTDPFFYTRLRVKMDRKQRSLKPVWMVAGLSLLLIINGFLLAQQFTVRQGQVATSSPLQSFAASYDLTIQSSY